MSAADDTIEPRTTPRHRALWCRAALLLVAAFAPGCGGLHFVHKSPDPSRPLDVVVIVADGAGNFQACSNAVRDAVADQTPLPLVHTFEWSHGFARILADQLDFDHAQDSGRQLARLIDEFHEQQPKCRIYLLGHSAGSSVVLSALEKVQPGVVDRAFLLAPSVSARYELTPSLRNVKHAIHVYYSKHDWYYLGFATHVVGTQDRKWIEPASGRVGFRYNPQTPDEEALALKLKQHPWKTADSTTGNLGGHFGVYQSEFLRRNVLPLTIRDANDRFLDDEDMTE